MSFVSSAFSSGVPSWGSYWGSTLLSVFIWAILVYQIIFALVLLYFFVTHKDWRRDR